MAGNYYRYSLHDERKRYQGALLQRSEAGSPTYVIDADFTDWARIIQKMHQRFGQVFPDAAVGVTAWTLEEDAADNVNNFSIKGGSNTAETAAAAYVGGLRALLYRDTDYKCEKLGAFNAAMADEIHHRYTSVAAGTLTDEHAKFTADALIGLSCHVGGTSYTITDNTETTLTLDGFDPVANPPDHQFYWIDLEPPAAGNASYAVYLDVHLEDWGMAEDSELNHNPGGTPVEAMRRLKLVQRVWVNQDINDLALMPTASYVDLTGTRHYVVRLATISRDVGDNTVVEGDIDNRLDGQFGSSDEVKAARDFGHCVAEADQPASLLSRLIRQESVVTVGNGTTSFGMYNGASGLEEALACEASTIFIKDGTYTFTSMVTVPADRNLVGQSLNVTLNVDDGGAAVAGILFSGNNRVEGITFRKAVGSAGSGAPAILIQGANVNFLDCEISDATDEDTVVISGASSRVRFLRTMIFTDGGTALRVAPTDAAYSSAMYASDDAPVAIEFMQCSIISKAAKQNSGAIEVGPGNVRFVSCTLQAMSDSTTGRLLFCFSNKGRQSGSPMASDRRAAVQVLNSLLVFEHGEALGADYAVICNGDRLSIQGCIVEGVADSNGTLPAYGLSVSSGERFDTMSLKDNCIRGFTEGIHVRQHNESEDAECIVANNVILPYSATLGNRYGINTIYTGAEPGVLRVHGNIVGMSAETVAAIEAADAVEVVGNTVVGKASVEVTVTGAKAYDDTLANGILVTARAVRHNAIVADNLLLGVGGVAIRVTGSNSHIAGRVEIRDNRVDGMYRTACGVDVEDNVATTIRGNTINSVRMQGILVRSPDAPVSVLNNTILDTGHSLPVGTYDASDQDHRIQTAGIFGAQRVEANDIDAFGSGVVVDRSHSTVKGNNITAGGVGIEVRDTTYIHIEASNNTLNECYYGGIWFHGSWTYVRGNKIRDTQLGADVDVFSSGVASICDNAIDATTATGAIIKLWNDVVRDTGHKQTVVNNTIVVNNTSARPAIRGLNTFGVVVAQNSIDARNAIGIYLTNTPVAQVRNNSVKAGRDDKLAEQLEDPPALNRSCRISGDASGVVIEGNNFSHGVAAFSPAAGGDEASFRIANNTCGALGIAVHPRGPLEICGNTIYGVNTRDPGAHVADMSGIFVGHLQEQTAVAVSDATATFENIVVCANTIHATADRGTDFDSPEMTNGRSAGIVVQAGSYIHVTNNRILAGSTSILVGSIFDPGLTAGATATRVGVSQAYIEYNHCRYSGFFPKIVGIFAAPAVGTGFYSSMAGNKLAHAGAGNMIEEAFRLHYADPLTPAAGEYFHVVETKENDAVAGVGEWSKLRISPGITLHGNTGFPPGANDGVGVNAAALDYTLDTA